MYARKSNKANYDSFSDLKISSIIYFDSLKLLNDYDSYIHFIMYFSLGLLSINSNEKRRVPINIFFIKE